MGPAAVQPRPVGRIRGDPAAVRHGLFRADLDRYVRRYRELYLSTGRKNGKTELLGGLVLLLLVGDDEEAAEIYGLALDKDQAALAYNAAARMVALSPVLGRRLTVTAGARRIIDERMASFFAVTAGDALGALGTGPHAAYIDELLTQPDRELYDAIRTRSAPAPSR